MLDVSFVGDHGSDIENINRNLNAQPLNTLNTDNSRTVAQNTNNTNLGATVRNPFCTTITNNVCTGQLYTGTGTTISRRTLLSPFPNFGGITTSNNDGTSWAHCVSQPQQTIRTAMAWARLHAIKSGSKLLSI